jgi:S1-C subfamily serine protease
VIDEPPAELRTGPIRFRLKRRPIRPELLAIVVILAIGSAALWASDMRLQRLLEREQARVEGLADLVEDAGQGRISLADFEAARAEMEDVLTQTEARVSSLEEAAGARERVIAEAGRSVLFIQGSYGFVDPSSGRPLRYFYGQGDRPLRLPDGRSTVTTGGEGPLVQIFYTGTAFIVDETGLLVTNRHVAYPWDFESNARFTLQAGFVAERRGFVGFLPGVDHAIELEPVAASDSADVALLRIKVPAQPKPDRPPLQLPPPLVLAEHAPHLGDEVVVMGYPAGVDALLARADPMFAEGLLSRGPVTFWEVGQALAVGGYIDPLHTQGIVGQVTDAMVVYDAETTSGGSGGPVMALDGTVVAVNTAVLSQFSGSNLGVPAREVRALLDALRQEAAAAR